MNRTNEILLNYLQHSDYTVSIGGYGAIAEYEGWPIEVESTDSTINFFSNNEKGAFVATILPNNELFAQESLSSNNRLWHQELVVTEKIGGSTYRSGNKLEEVGLDNQSLAAEGKKHLLFNLGTGLGNSIFCVRTDDRELISVLRNYLGKQITTKNHPAIESVVKASPTRVVISKVGRIEVYQKISRVRTPKGPHTHLLPELLKEKKTHSQKLVLPPNTMPVLSFHPRRISRLSPLGAKSCQQFDRILKSFGNRDYFNAKIQIIRALRSRESPLKLLSKSSSIENTALRVALIQSRHYFPSGKLATKWLAELSG